MGIEVALVVQRVDLPSWKGWWPESDGSAKSRVLSIDLQNKLKLGEIDEEVTLMVKLANMRESVLSKLWSYFISI